MSLKRQEKVMSEEYTPAELMACIFARDIKDGEEGAGPGVRSAVPTAAILLARYTHAPNVNTNIGMVINSSQQVTKLTVDESRLKGAEALFLDHSVGFDRSQKGVRDFAFVGGMQVDKYGNVNLVCVGDYYRPTLRGPGSAGLAVSTLARRLYIWITQHSRRMLVERVDFISCPGYIDGPGTREKAGLLWGRPALVVSPLAVMDFDDDTRRMRLKSVHPGVSVEQVIENTGFELILPKEVPQTPPPSAEELHVLRTVVDPEGVLREFVPFG